MSLLQALKLPTPPAPGAKPSTAHGSAADKDAATGKGAEKATEKLLHASEAWRQTHGEVNGRIAALKTAVKDHCADAHPALVQEIEKGLVKLDQVLDNIDHRLADVLASAASEKDEAARKGELKSAKALLAEYIAYVKGETLIAHMDSNPFAVKTDLKALIVSGLNTAAKAIG